MIEAIVTATARALDRPERVVIAHFFSILPKIGLDEADVAGWSRIEHARGRDRADRPGDRGLRALALPVAAHAPSVPRPRRADPARAPTATRATRSAATTYCADVAVRRARRRG